MGKIWNLIKSKNPEEYRQREILRHTKRIADRLEKKKTKEELMEEYELAYCPKCNEEIELTRKQLLEIINKGEAKIKCPNCKKNFTEG